MPPSLTSTRKFRLGIILGFVYLAVFGLGGYLIVTGDASRQNAANSDKEARSPVTFAGHFKMTCFFGDLRTTPILVALAGC
jgi:hypothetical protein